MDEEIAIPLLIEDVPVPLRQDEDGAIRVGKTRIPLDTVVIAFQQGASAEGIVESYPTLSLEEVYAVIAYYLRRKAEVEDYLRVRANFAAGVREENQRRFPSNGLREKLLARRASGL